MSHRNHPTREGNAIRVSECKQGRKGRKSRGRRSELLATVPGIASEGPVDGEALAAELVRLTAMARRGWNT